MGPADSQIIFILIQLTIGAVITVFGFFAKRMFDQYTETLRMIQRQIEHCHERNDVQDAILSQIVREQIDSSYIVRQGLAVPKVAKGSHA